MAEAQSPGQVVQLGRVLRVPEVRAPDDHPPGFGVAVGEQRRGCQDVLDPLLAVEPADPTEHRDVVVDVPLATHLVALGGVELGQVDQGGNLQGVLGPLRHAGGGRVSDRGAHPDVAGGARCSMSGGREGSRCSAGCTYGTA